MSLDESTRRRLAATPGLLEEAFGAVTRDYRHWQPSSWEAIPGERFTAVGQICHLRDIEIDGYHVRIERLLAEVNPSLVSVDGYELADRRGYGTADPEQALVAFRAARKVTLQRLETLTDRQLDRRGDFAEYGSLTLRSLVFYLLSHDQQHLACMSWLLGKVAAETARAT
jgi:hypothetical protein